MKKTIMFLFAAATAVTLCSMTDAVGPRAMRPQDSRATPRLLDGGALAQGATLTHGATAMVADSFMRALQDTSRKDTTRRDTTHRR